MANRRYSEQFKRDAVRLVNEEGYTREKAADAVGVHPKTLEEWDVASAVVPPDQLTFASQQDEINYLRKEDRRLRMEREILMRAAI
ncbi:MAG: transposase [Phycisphaerales bacterium]